jgi:serine/threonine-protein kinase
MRSLVGTLHYCSPELFGTLDEIGPASDVYSLGVLLFQMLTGRLPFDGSSAAQLAESIIHCPTPDPRDAYSPISPRIAQLIRRMLAKQPDRRPNVPALIDWMADMEIETFNQRSAA